MDAATQVTSLAALEDLVGVPGERARTKERTRLTDIDRWGLA